MSSLESMFRQNSDMRDAVTPYLSKYNQFNWISIPLASTVPQALQNFEAEFLLIQARSTNAGVIHVWNSTLTIAEGIPLSASDVVVMSEDNEAWNTAEALAQVMGRKNPLPRRAIRSGDIFIVASAATQIADVLFGFGPQL